MKFARFVALPILVAAAACSSESSTDQDPGLQGDGQGAAAQAPDTNPDGVAYPTENIGTRPRSGDKAGNLIANYKFVGYPDGDVTKGLQPMSLAQFYDPEGKTYKLIHLTASGVWCTYCQKEAEAVSPIIDQVNKRKVVWLTSLAEGPGQGSLATQKDLDGWIKEFKVRAPHVLDPGNQNLGVFYDAAALPWQGTINAETMEILASGTGAATTGDAILKDLDEWLQKLDKGELDPK